MVVRCQFHVARHRGGLGPHLAGQGSALPAEAAAAATARRPSLVAPTPTMVETSEGEHVHWSRAPPRRMRRTGHTRKVLANGITGQPPCVPVLCAASQRTATTTCRVRHAINGHAAHVPAYLLALHDSRSRLVRRREGVGGAAEARRPPQAVVHGPHGPAWRRGSRRDGLADASHARRRRSWGPGRRLRRCPRGHGRQRLRRHGDVGGPELKDTREQIHGGAELGPWIGRAQPCHSAPNPNPASDVSCCFLCLGAPCALTPAGRGCPAPSRPWAAGAAASTAQKTVTRMTSSRRDSAVPLHHTSHMVRQGLDASWSTDCPAVCGAWRSRSL